ncbi:MAG: hypothetical protein LBH59_08795 [Planctomycetaceae bacterium]|jgi:hypothetical protein|nr:hypothetical protein [Planctomycetaceae bacterium]
MRFNIGTIISFILLLFALLFNIFRYPQVQDMLGQELQRNLIPSVLSYNPDNPYNSVNSDNITDSDESDEPQDSSMLTRSEVMDKSELPVVVPQPDIFGNAAIQSPMPQNPTSELIPNSPPQPIQQESIWNSEPIQSPEPTQNPEPAQASQLIQSSALVPVDDQVARAKELLPESNLGNESTSKNLSLQKILSEKSLVGTARYDANANYVIYNNQSVAAPISDSPKPIYANNYQPIKIDSNKLKIKKQSKQITRPKQRLINTVETTIDRPIIYD